MGHRQAIFLTGNGQDMSLVPQTYEEWKHCITVKCGIALTPHYARERIAGLADKKDFHTQKFIECWGADYHGQTLAWFRRAEAELRQT
jgi:hypothetical protein